MADPPREVSPGPEDSLQCPESQPDGDEEREIGPLRRCVVTRERGERAAMLRFVVGPDGALVPDLAARLPGRGIWLSARSDVVEAARARGAFARAARGPVSVPADLLAMLQAGLSSRVADLLGFARRAGQAVAGYAKVREWLQAGRTALVLQAADGSPDERSRLLSGARELPVCTALSAARLGAVFGRDHVVHVAVARGRLAEQLAVDAGRLAGLLAPFETRPAGGKAGTARTPRPRRGARAGSGAPTAPRDGVTSTGTGHDATRAAVVRPNEPGLTAPVGRERSGAVVSHPGPGGPARDRPGGNGRGDEGPGGGGPGDGRPGRARPGGGRAGKDGSVATPAGAHDAGRRQGGQTAMRRVGRSGMPAAARDVPTGAPVEQQSGRAGA